MRKQYFLSGIVIFMMAITMALTSCGDSKEPSPTFSTGDQQASQEEGYAQPALKDGIALSEIPEFVEDPYVVVNGNIPFFTGEEIGSATTSWEEYGKLDALGRCTACWASVGKDLMPTGERGSIGSVKPTGWHTIKYEFIDGKYLYNRAHLIGWQLTGENANERNLVTGTRYFNVIGMLPFENMVADYIKEEGGHVLYRVTPMFDGDDLVCKGVLMEAMSVEDNGEGIMFNVFVYNIQPGVVIDYDSGESYYAGSEGVANESASSSADICVYVLNTNTKKFHIESCPSISSMNSANKEIVALQRDEIISDGYSPCKSCNP